MRRISSTFFFLAKIKKIWILKSKLNLILMGKFQILSRINMMLKKSFLSINYKTLPRLLMAKNVTSSKIK